MEEVERESGAEGRTGVTGSESSGSVRTVFVFLDVPVHYEFRAGVMPLMAERTEIVFGSMTIRGKDSRTRVVEGPYTVARRVLRYGDSRPGLAGLTQYLEMSPTGK